MLGREFSPRLLAAIWDGTGALEPLLLGLKRQEFLYERTGVAEPMVVFKHALTQEVAYGSLLTTRRQALHAAAGQALETLAQERLAERYEASPITSPWAKSGTKRLSTLPGQGTKPARCMPTRKRLPSTRRRWR